jgi:hypothetical protein
MVISMTHKCKAIRVAVLLAALLLIAGCSAFKPFHPPNHREEGPAKGLFTGSQGEWVIFGPQVPQKGEEQKKDASQQTGCEGEQKQPPQTSSDGEP